MALAEYAGQAVFTIGCSSKRRDPVRSDAELAGRFRHGIDVFRSSFVGMPTVPSMIKPPLSPKM